MNDAFAPSAAVAGPVRRHRLPPRRRAPRDPPEEEGRRTETHPGEGMLLNWSALKSSFNHLGHY